MGPDELKKYGKQGGIGTCIALKKIEGSNEMLECQIGDVITILKPIDENIYLGMKGERVGHFRLEDVSVIYLNLSMASPRKNPKFQSFTKLLEARVPTGDYSELGEGLAKMRLNEGLNGLQDLKEVDESNINGEDTLEQRLETKLGIKESLEEMVDEKETNLDKVRKSLSQNVKDQNTKRRGFSLMPNQDKDTIKQALLEYEKIEEEVRLSRENSKQPELNIIHSESLNLNIDLEQHTKKDVIPSRPEDKVYKIGDSYNGKNEDTLKTKSIEKPISTNKVLNPSEISNSSNKLTPPSTHPTSPRSLRYSPSQSKLNPNYKSNSNQHQSSMFRSLRKFKSKADQLITAASLSPSLVLLPNPSKHVDNNQSSEQDISSNDDNAKTLEAFWNHAHQKGDAITLDRFGFIQAISDDDDNTSIISSKSSNGSTINFNMDKVFKYELTKESKWRAISQRWSPEKARRSYRVKKLVEKGIPEGIRGNIWSYLAGVRMFRKEGVYQEMLNREKIPIYDVIERDLRRTYPKHSLFYYEDSPALQRLDNVLKAYAQHTPEIGYCQGMGMLVGLFLMQGLGEEDAFWLLVATNASYLQGYFTPTLGQLRIHSAVFEYLLGEQDPKLARHLKANEITSLLYVTPWFLTVYTMTLPWPSVLRVWDLFYYKGVKVLFRVGLAIMSCIRGHLLTQCPTAGELLPFLLHIPHTFLEPDALFSAYHKVKITTQHIQNLCTRVLGEDGKVPERGALKVRV